MQSDPGLGSSDKQPQAARRRHGECSNRGSNRLSGEHRVVDLLRLQCPGRWRSPRVRTLDPAGARRLTDDVDECEPSGVTETNKSVTKRLRARFPSEATSHIMLSGSAAQRPGTLTVALHEPYFVGSRNFPSHSHRVPCPLTILPS